MKIVSFLSKNARGTFIGASAVVLTTLSYNLGYYKAKLELPSANNIIVEDLMLGVIPTSAIPETHEHRQDFDTVFYVSSDVLDKDGSTLNRIGVRFNQGASNPDVFMVEVCDSVNKECVTAAVNQKALQDSKSSMFDYDPADRQ